MQFVVSSPIGALGFSLEEDKLYSLQFLGGKAKPTALTKAARVVATELKQFFSNPEHRFSLSFEMKGTAFQKRVWQALQKIPSGKVRTYKDIALQLDTGARAVGNACRANPLLLIVPCHRVVAKNGLGGFAGKTRGMIPQIKEWLLAHEQRSPSNGKRRLPLK